MYAISKDFEFSAAHRLEGLAPEHPCSRLHGHNYVVRLTLRGDLNAIGFVYDYRALAPFKEHIDARIDHRYLNDLVPWNPTAEALASWLWEIAGQVLDLPSGVRIASVGVSETAKTWAVYTP